ncbi:potassium channel family protein [Aneurinibacillus aneurinilyticus]|jgi:potassium channel LctB|uniref:Two pore domain potassium channel family protein n=2 Tax=Aneurinibacillus aneurinilyticus TaxID=1391 RepID=A0A848CX53_ANEAE|nr:potassium channel family protein [Aneurinibacillus aneurinilyticus]ERI10538.1 Ion channel [Aneurinibacillus aneurinilyticus ATCC 12856]MCI1693710.1 potassium channel family protein [Aneurinibacillus aneurinilyticus]MED0669463.1 potassium channel family protein [Aneurinibacillus aneurinilyticus]MED0709042.1 potassium channel family protein [Aneurinibacillus aneurinilyticus]MED0725436.1 potassium channel family protein [Aneurinibacillus aneurinilyticus]
MKRAIIGRKTWHNFLVLFLLYMNLVLSFGLIYCLIEWSGLGFIRDHYASYAHQQQWHDRFTRSFYFSAITLLSVGYGDLSPFGLARGVAILEAMTGYVLPAALVIRYFTFSGPEGRKFRLSGWRTPKK